MILTDKLKGMAKEAAAVRESLSASRFLSAGSFAKEGEGRESGRRDAGVARGGVGEAGSDEFWG